MSIQNEINRINNNIATAYSAIENKNGQLPETKNSNNLAQAIESIQPNILTPGDGLSISGDTINVDTPVQSILAQAEYDALSAEQQQKGLYVIHDGNSNANSYMNIYSTEETKIGIWIDGKPLYRKVYKTVTGNTSNWEILFQAPSNVDTVMISRAFVVPSDGVDMLPILIKSGGLVRIRFDPSLNSIFYVTTAQKYNNIPITVILEYTKTTD